MLEVKVLRDSLDNHLRRRKVALPQVTLVGERDHPRPDRVHLPNNKPNICPHRYATDNSVGGEAWESTSLKLPAGLGTRFEEEQLAIALKQARAYWGSTRPNVELHRDDVINGVGFPALKLLYDEHPWKLHLALRNNLHKLATLFSTQGGLVVSVGNHQTR